MIIYPNGWTTVAVRFFGCALSPRNGHRPECSPRLCRFGVWGEWEEPYLTLNPKYEAAQLEVFGKMFLNGHIYRGRKPVHWSPSSQTALAEAVCPTTMLPKPSLKRIASTYGAAYVLGEAVNTHHDAA